MRFTYRTTSSPLPLWARLLDAVCLLLALVAVVIALSGGFRERFFGLRIALTSPVPSDDVGGDARRRPLICSRGSVRSMRSCRTLAGRMADGAMRSAVGAPVGTDWPILFVGYMAIFMIGFPSGAGAVANRRERVREPAGALGCRLVSGYCGRRLPVQRSREGRRQQQDIVFFPALPLLMRVTGRLFGGVSSAYVWGRAVVSAFSAGSSTSFDWPATCWGETMQPLRSGSLPPIPSCLLQRPLHRVVLSGRTRGCVLPLQPRRMRERRGLGADGRTDAAERCLLFRGTGSSRARALAAGQAGGRSRPTETVMSSTPPHLTRHPIARRSAPVRTRSWR